VGGSPKFKSSRSLFYGDCDGVIFVWDVSFEASYLTLNDWLDEIKQSESKNKNKCKSHTSMDILSEYPNESSFNYMLPLFIVGNKIDKLRQKDFQEIQKLNRQNILMVVYNKYSQFIDNYILSIISRPEQQISMQISSTNTLMRLFSI